MVRSRPCLQTLAQHLSDGFPSKSAAVQRARPLDLAFDGIPKPSL